MALLPASALPFLAAALALTSAVAFLLVGRAVQLRVVSPESVLARNAFVAWWYTLGAVTILGATMALPGIPLDLGLFLSLTVANILLLCVGLWGLLFYLVFLFTSRRNLALPLAFAYVAYFALLVYFIFAGEPSHVEAGKWGATVKYADPIESGPLYWAVILLLILPPFVAAAGYLSLYWKVDQSVQKRRVLLVSLSILVWFGSALVGTAFSASGSDWWRIVSRLIGLAAAGAIYYAYKGLEPAEPAASVTAPASATESPLYLPPKKGAAPIVSIV